jgi:hypothetical protein
VGEVELEMRTLEEKASKAVRNAERNLNAAFTEYASHEGGAVKSTFLSLKLQASLVQYELCADIETFQRTQPSGFARKVFLKNVLHKIVEYTDTLRHRHLQKIVALSSDRGLNTRTAQLQAISREWRRKLNTEQFRALRNKASGHYDADIRAQIAVIEQLDEDAALDTVVSFLEFDLQILAVLQAVGANKDT